MDIIIDKVTKQYNGKTALHETSLTIPSGKTTAIMGRSGSGKSTLLRLIARLTKPSTGKITVPEGKLSFVFQDNVLVGSLTPTKNIAFAVGKSATAEEIEAHLTELGLADDMAKKCEVLSGGMRRRVAIARAVLAKPDIMLMDEPFKGLDEATRASVVDYVKRYTKGKTVIMVTHDPDEVGLMAADNVVEI